MWRDTLIIASFVLAGLMYFGLTPRRLSAYAKTAKREITRRSVYQKVFLFVVIALTPFYIFFTIWRFETLGLGGFLMSTALFILAVWCRTLTDVWELSERGEKLVRVVQYSVVLPLFVAGIILTDMLLWQKLAYPLGGVSGGFGARVLEAYIRKKREDRHPSKEGGNQS